MTSNLESKITYCNILRVIFLIILFSSCTGKISLRGIGIPFEFGEKVENMIFFMLILWLPALRFYPNLRIKGTVLDISILFFLVFCTVSLIMYSPGINHYLKIISLIIAYYIAYSLFSGDIWRKRLIYTLLCAFIYSFSAGIYLFINGVYFTDTPGRILTIFKHPNITAFMANIAVLISLGAVPFVKTKKERIFLIISTSIGLLCLVITFSRTAWISFLISFILLLFLLRKPKLSLYLILFLLLIGIAAGTASKEVREKSLSILRPNQEVNVLYRIKYFQGAINMIKAHPITGIGMGQKRFMDQYSNYMVEQTIERPIHCHSTYLQIGATTGIGSLICLILILVQSFYNLLKNIKTSPAVFNKGMYIGITAALISFCIGFISECPIYFTNVMLVFWVLLIFSNRRDKLTQISPV